VAGFAQDLFSLGLVLFEVLTGASLFATDAEALSTYRQLDKPEVCFL
jgi:hypothetical protein